MTPNKPLIVGNWKMNGSLSFIKETVSFWNNQQIVNPTVVCPPFVYLEACKNLISSPLLGLGAQDCHPQASGAFTGNISAQQLADIGCQYAIVGHSERRQYHAESNALVREKAQRAIDCNLTPIICIGENLADRESGLTLEFLAQQVTESLPEKSTRIIIAYEPIWSIGTGKTAAPENIAEVHQFLRQNLGLDCRLLYGGSVTAANYKEILGIPNVDGVLVGGASLKKEDFAKMMMNAD
ncbi:MAG: triose-phosphate isomerase [Alphaproteobacteria bacterium]|nr:triose-phosphate isomerase [Alphaproteobacteria bacterium]